MKQNIIKITMLIALLTGWFSCADDRCDCNCPQGAAQVINFGEKTASFAIDSNIISFAVPYVACTFINEHPSTPGRVPNSITPAYWTITLLMPKGTDFTKLAPIITLAPGATITLIYEQDFKYVDYTGIAKIGAMDFSKQVDIRVIAPDGSAITYSFIARYINDFGT